jgi:anti-anti-sigma factor
MGVCEAVDSFTNNNSVTIQLAEHFDYRSVHHFKQAYQGNLNEVIEVVVDMAFTRYIDSSGIALLMRLCHWVSHPACVVKVTHCRPAVRQILALARCEGRFVFE